MTTDKLEQMFSLQEKFMERLKEKHENFPEWPLDISAKQSQIECKNLAFNSMGELFEAVQELKNSKTHRKTHVIEFDKDKFLEELVDAYKYFLEILIFVGITPDEFFEAYKRKDTVLHRRISDGY